MNFSPYATESLGCSTAGGRELRLRARPPARFTSQSNAQNTINLNQQDHESETACLFRTLRCLLSVSQRARRSVEQGVASGNSINLFVARVTQGTFIGRIRDFGEKAPGLPQQTGALCKGVLNYLDSR